MFEGGASALPSWGECEKGRNAPFPKRCGRPIRPGDVDLRWVSALIYRNGVIEDSGVAAAVLGHPALGPAWLANKLHPYGETLEAGEIILGGSFTAPVLAEAARELGVDMPIVEAVCRLLDGADVRAVTRDLLSRPLREEA